MGRSKIFVLNSEDETSTDVESANSMDDFLNEFSPLRLSRLRKKNLFKDDEREEVEEDGDEEESSTEVAGPSGISAQRRPNSNFGIVSRLRRRRQRPVIENRSTSGSNTTSNSPRESTEAPSPKLPRLTFANSRILSARRRRAASTILDSSPPPPAAAAAAAASSSSSNIFNRTIVISDDEDERGGARMNTGAAAGGEEEDSDRGRRLSDRVNRFWATASGRPRRSGDGRSTAASASATTERRVRQQQQLEADEAYARRLQAQYDAQVYAEQQQRRRREAAALRRQTRSQANSYRPSTPPPRMRDFVEPSYDEEDDDDEFHLPYALASILMERSASEDHPHPPRTRGHRRASPNSGPTTLATVRRYFREAHMDAALFPDANVSVLDFEALLELADQLGDGAPAMSATEINRLPTSVYRQSTHTSDVVDHSETSSSASGSSSNTNYGDEAPNCAVCMDKFVDGDVQRNLPCFHAFHKDCVDVWLKQKSSCPVCRVDARHASPPGSP